MLKGCTPWPEDFAARYRAKGYWEGRTLSQVMDEAIARHGEREALVHGAERITYAQLGRRVDRLAYRLSAGGLKPLDRVILQLPNTPAFVYAFLALVKIGVIPVMALRPHRHTEIRHFVAHAGAKGYFIPDRIRDFDYRDMADEIRAESGTLEYIFVAGETRGDHVSLDALIGDPPDDEAAAQAAVDALLPDPAEVALMLLSGGTTALPKLIPRTHNDYVYNFRQSGRVAGVGADTVLLAVLPLAHNYSLGSPGMMATFDCGGTVVIAPGIDADAVFSTVEKEKVTLIPAAVPLVTQWVNSEAPGRHDLSSLRTIQNGGARLAPELRKAVRERLGVFPQEIFGTAEGLLNIVRPGDDDERVLHSSGAPVCDDDEIKVVGENDEEVADGEPGELVVRGPYTIRGYYRNPKANADGFTEDGFYRMGDYVRKRGRYIYAEGRKKDLINRGGEKISCEEVENLILTNPKVKAAVLVAMPDPVYGEKACAFVVPQPGAALGFDELIDHLMAKQIAKFKLPERLEIVDAFPISPAGKIMRRHLREQIEAKMAAEGTE